MVVLHCRRIVAPHAFRNRAAHLFSVTTQNAVNHALIIGRPGNGPTQIRLIKRRFAVIQIQIGNAQ
ncbi:Uncharacterised protein [Shigella sonnei]|nr:Uncharacterised protein [Shigella sonnei]